MPTIKASIAKMALFDLETFAPVNIGVANEAMNHARFAYELLINR